MRRKVKESVQFSVFKGIYVGKKKKKSVNIYVILFFF